MNFYYLNPQTYDGFRFQIPFDTYITADIMSWIEESLPNRRWRAGRYANDTHRIYVELMDEQDLDYFLLKWS